MKTAIIKKPSSRSCLMWHTGHVGRIWKTAENTPPVKQCEHLSNKIAANLFNILFSNLFFHSHSH